jgi:CDP-glucose 4,6-dehydratase
MISRLKQKGHSMDVQETFAGIYKDLPVLVTGHTGFKGTWLSMWLNLLGARVIGYSLEPPTMPNHFDMSGMKDRMVDIRDNIGNLDKLVSVIEEFQPKVIFHLAAQSIVRESYENPRDTFVINSWGTINVLEAIRLTRSVKAAVFITSDKCYRNKEWIWGYRENDSLGGGDPYSASKAMAEIAIEAYRDAYFPWNDRGEHAVAVASVRAGNVVGGGDWAKDRLLPDAIRALTEGRTIDIRSPRATRPWQFVFSPLCGYMWLGVKLLLDGAKFAEPWNFGPIDLSSDSVQHIVEKVIKLWGSGQWKDISRGDEPHEVHWLTLSWEKAATRLDWHPIYALPDVLRKTVEWYKEWHRQGENADMYDFGLDQIRTYIKDANKLKIRWACPQPGDRLQRKLIR